ncbi:uncharacterized protein J8A68_005205 [[Candida] subhashii]|uniref:Biogenesis of lysosome-related organelles complex 1 subunit CNL1 n=1 Tax=[Candida] subhashii TaxID=561895 RepID=A0A8J5QI97_9ASCO|nr:uncharacterized protein J8A68_005205 [[Candida] subhashii]KAG7661313.1 hypothetical protein J8A68_005205 [[Candida] subhashii]
MEEESSNLLPNGNETTNEEEEPVVAYRPTEDPIENEVDQAGTKSPTPSETDPDPLELRQLAVSYDYLIYKIGDHMQTLMETTYASILNKQDLINSEYFDKQLQLSKQFEQIDRMLEPCNKLELEFLKLDQLGMFIADFKQRLNVLESEFSELDHNIE